MGILVDMSGILPEDFKCKGLTDRQVSERADWDINDVFNDSTTQEVELAPSHDAVDLILITTTRILKVEPPANKVTHGRENSGCISAI